MDDRTPPAGGPDPAEERVDVALAALLARDDVWADAPDVEDAIVAAIAAESATAVPAVTAESAAAVPEVTAESADGSGPASGVVELSSRRRGRLLGGLAAAAALVAVVGAGIVLLARDTGSDPDVELALAATELAPGASAVAAIDTTPIGVKLVLDVTGLPPAEPGTYYQAWVRNEDEGVSAGRSTCAAATGRSSCGPGWRSRTTRSSRSPSRRKAPGPSRRAASCCAVSSSHPDAAQRAAARRSSTTCIVAATGSRRVRAIHRTVTMTVGDVRLEALPPTATSERVKELDGVHLRAYVTAGGALVSAEPVATG